MAESEEELKNFLMKVKEESENVGLKFNIQKMKVLPYIKMNLPQVYMCSPSWTLLPPHTIPLGCPSAPAPSIQYCALNLDWQNQYNIVKLNTIKLKKKEIPKKSI